MTEENYEIKIPYRGTEEGPAALGLFDHPTKTLPIWTVMMALYKYPYPHLMNDVKFLTIAGSDKTEFPYRSILHTPVYHPTLKDFRLCPNFPSVCINKEGVVRPVHQPEILVDGKSYMDENSIVFDTLGVYVLTTVPGKNVPQFVSLIQLHGDAWCPPSNAPYELVYFAPRDGNYTNLTPENVYRVTAWKKSKYKEYLKGETLCHALYNPNPISDRLHRALVRTQGKFSDFRTWEFDCVYAGLQNVSVKRFGNCIDWCFNTYWAVCLYKPETQDAVVATSLKELTELTDIRPKEARWMLKNQKKCRDAILFQL